MPNNTLVPTRAGEAPALAAQRGRYAGESKSEMSSGFHRDTLFPSEYMFGLDSTQGYLEFADSSQDNKRQIAFRKSDEADFLSHFFKLKQLEREKLIEVIWASEAIEGVEYIKIEQMCLTISGKDLLEKLRSNSRRGRLRVQLRNLFWTVLTSIITTLVVLYFKNEA